MINRTLFLLLLMSINIGCENKKDRKRQRMTDDVNLLKDFSISTDIVAAPDNYDTHLRLEFIADSVYSKNQYQDAFQLYDKLIKIDSSKGMYYYRRAYSHQQCYQRPMDNSAIKDYLQAIELNYRNEDAYYNLALIHCFAKDSIALFYFNKCRELNPYYPEVYIDVYECKKRLAESEKEKNIYKSS